MIERLIGDRDPDVAVRRAKRAVARGRWINKTRAVRASGASPRDHLAHVLWSPELESFSYELANAPEIADQLARILERPAEELHTYLAELDVEPDLGLELRRRTRWRWRVQTQPAPGNRVAWYLLARALKPQLTVETGIYDGLGSLVLLCALRRNAAERHPGELLSVDPDPDAGTLVPDHLRPWWRFVLGTADRDLEPALAGRRIDLLFSDSPHTRENQEAEFAIARRHAGDDLVLMEGSGGWCPVLAELADRLDRPLHTLRFEARGHFYTGARNGLLHLPARAATPSLP